MNAIDQHVYSNLSSGIEKVFSRNIVRFTTYVSVPIPYVKFLIRMTCNTSVWPAENIGTI